jgi:hypothetical protein
VNLVAAVSGVFRVDAPQLMRINQFEGVTWPRWLIIRLYARDNWSPRSKSFLLPCHSGD